MNRRFLTMLVALLCVLMLAPVPAIAAEPQAKIGDTTYATLQEALDAAKEGDTVHLLSDITLTDDSSLTVAPATAISFTLDLGGKTISYPKRTNSAWGGYYAALTIAKPVTMTIVNGAIDAGRDGVSSTGVADDINGIQSACGKDESFDLTLRNVKITSGGAGIMNYADEASSLSNRITLDGVEIAAAQYGIYSYNAPADIVFKSGSIHTVGDECFYLYGGTLTVDGGEFTTEEDGTAQLMDGCAATINGGQFKSLDDVALYIEDDNTKVTINGGIFETPDGELAIRADSSTQVVLGDNRRSIYRDGSTIGLFDDEYVEVIPDVVTLTFMDGNEQLAQVKVRNRQSVDGDDLLGQSMPTAPTKEGYTFVCWSTTPDGSGDEFTGDTVVDDDMTVYAVFRKNQEPAEPTAPAEPFDQNGDSAPSAPDSKPAKKSIPKTGDETFAVLPVALLGGAAAAIGLRRKGNCR